MKTIILIPARMASTRLPNKPLALIGGEPMILHVWRRAVAAHLGEVVVACDGEAIAGVIRNAGGKAVITDADLPSGSDRIHQALQKIDAGKTYDAVINVQGDMPALAPALIGQVAALLEDARVDIGTLACPFEPDGSENDPSLVKAVFAFEGHAGRGRALYFSRCPVPYGDGPFYHHIGIYAYRRAALEKFVTLPPSPLEMCEKLEQLRALEAGLRIEVGIVDTVPLGVDTAEGLEKARKILEG